MKSYVVSQVEVIDREEFEKYRALAAPAIARFGGRYLVRGATPEVMEGEDWAPPAADRQQIVVVEFPNAEAIHAWYASPEYAEALIHRRRALRRRLLLVDGVEEPKV